MTFTGALKIAANWFPPSQFGMMSALTATVGVLGALIGSAPLAALAAGLSWRGALIIVGAVTVAGALLCAALVRDRPASGPEAGPRGGSPRNMMAGMVQVLRNPYTWPPFLCFFFLYAAMGNFFLWSVPFLRDIYGLTTTKAALYASLPSMALLASAPFTGYLSDRVLRRRKLPLHRTGLRPVPRVARLRADPRHAAAPRRLRALLLHGSWAAPSSSPGRSGPR